MCVSLQTYSRVVVWHMAALSGSSGSQHRVSATPAVRSPYRKHPEPLLSKAVVASIVASADGRMRSALSGGAHVRWEPFSQGKVVVAYVDVVPELRAIARTAEDATAAASSKIDGTPDLLSAYNAVAARTTPAVAVVARVANAIIDIPMKCIFCGVVPITNACAFRIARPDGTFVSDSWSTVMPGGPRVDPFVLTQRAQVQLLVAGDICLLYTGVGLMNDV